MRPRNCFVLIFLCAAACPANEIDKSQDWPWWRGPSQNGIAFPHQDPPSHWSATENIVWRAKVPGRGHGSPTVIGGSVILATADEAKGIQSVLCYGRDDGKPRWKTKVHAGGLETKGNKKASQASATAAFDGERIFIAFLNRKAVYATALSPAGEELWQQKICDYVVHQGYGPSPAVFGPLVIVAADNKGGGAVAGLDRQTGRIVWRRDRPQTPNYASPIIYRLHGRDQLLFQGCDLVTSLNPLTGQTLWEFEGATTECVASLVTDGDVILTSGGYPKNHISAVRADGSGKVTWETNDRVYVPSMIIQDGYAYAVLDAGVAACFEVSTGKRIWRKRLGGVFTSSPVLAGGRIYATNEAGTTFVYEANPKRFVAVSQNQLGQEVFASPAICGGRIYARVAHWQDGQRQEWLYCIGNAGG